MALSTSDSDQRDFRESSPGLRLVLICVLSIAMMFLDNQNQYLQDARRLLSAATYPIRVVINAPFSMGRWASDSLATRTALIKENDDYKRRIMIQSAKLQRMAALDAENARLRALLESTAKVGDRVLIAEIMSVDMNPFRHRIVVNKGGNDGVYVGQALIDAQGIVGQVTRDEVFSAEAVLITDVDHALPVELVRNRLRTIAVGTGDLERLSLPFLPRNADVQQDDLLVTSGLGGTFPPGYPVGIVGDVQSNSGEPFLSISAEPAAELNRIREVLLIWPEPQQSEQTSIVDTGDAAPVPSETGPTAIPEPTAEPGPGVDDDQSPDPGPAETGPAGTEGRPVQEQ